MMQFIIFWEVTCRKFTWVQRNPCTGSMTFNSWENVELKDPLCLMLVFILFFWFRLVWIYCQLCDRYFHTLPFTRKNHRKKYVHCIKQSTTTYNKPNSPKAILDGGKTARKYNDATGNVLLFPSLINVRSTWLNFLLRLINYLWVNVGILENSFFSTLHESLCK